METKNAAEQSVMTFDGVYEQDARKDVKAILFFQFFLSSFLEI